MRWPYLAFGSILAAGLFSSCGTTGTTAGGRRNPRGTGPFDSHGNYIEALADNPSSKNRPASIPNDEPPPDSIPLAAGGNSSIPSVGNSTKHKKSSGEVASSSHSHPVEVASRTKRAASSTKHTETASRAKEVETPVKTKKHTETASRTKESETPVKTKHTGTTAETTSKSKHTATASGDTPSKTKHTVASADTPKKAKKSTETDETPTKSKTKKSTETAATTKKTKPAAHASSSYTVKPGDSLDRIARHSRVSVSSLKKANDLNGDMIHPGKKLVIPRD